MVRGLLGGALGGAAWGVVARLFMRLLSDDPQFSWAGTLGILGIATITGACVGLVHGARVTGRSRWWRLAALPGLLLFAGPGSLLAPAAVGMAAVLRGRAPVRVAGALLVAVSPVVLVTTSPAAPTTVQLAGLALMVLCAAPLGWALGDVVGRWRRSSVRPAVSDAAARTPSVALA
jgi:hypothetical protein